jgi:hypothetical protein
MVAGNGSAMVYARPGEPRGERWPIERLRKVETLGGGVDLIEALLREPAVAFLAAESENGDIWIGAGHGEAHLRARGSSITYQLRTGDPLQLGGSWRGTSREWLECTRNGTYPDAAFHLFDQFRTRRSGDLLVIANEGYDFRGRFEVPEHRAGHGSMIRVHMQTPVWSSHPVPDIPLRTVDLFPTMLQWLGVMPPGGIDGELVWVAKRRSSPWNRPDGKMSEPADLVGAVLPGGRGD